MTARTPALATSSIMRTTSGAGTRNTSRSTPLGSSSGEDRQGRPQTRSYFGLIG